MKRLIATSLVLLLTACANQVGTGHQAVDSDREDYRISVEIPLHKMRIEENAILRVNELLDERTHFKAENFELDEVVLIARGESADAMAELLMMEWRSGQFVVPAGAAEAEAEAEEWYEVRIPAPPEDLEGAWLLDIAGDVTIDLLVAVLEPRPAVAEVARTTAARTRTVYRNVPPQPTAYHTHWIYEPSRYYVYHYYDSWSYRYFIGPWNYRYYDLRFRPHRFHYGPLYRPWPRSYGRYREAPRNDRRPALPERRRLDPQLVKLRRNHPRLRSSPHGNYRRERRGDGSERVSAPQPHEPRTIAPGRLSNGRAVMRPTPRRLEERSPSRVNQASKPARSLHRELERVPRSAPRPARRSAEQDRQTRPRSPSSRVRALRSAERQSRTTVAAPPTRQQGSAQRRPSYRRPPQQQRPVRRVEPAPVRSTRRASAPPKTLSRQPSVERRAVQPTNARTRRLQRSPQPMAQPKRDTPRRPQTSPPPRRQSVARRQQPELRRAPPPAEKTSRRRSNTRTRTFERR